MNRLLYICVLYSIGLGFWAYPQSSSPAAVSSAQEAGDSVSGLDRSCVGSDSDDQGLISILNRCTFPVEATWFYGLGNQGFALIDPGASVTTGKTGADIKRLGVLRYFACPASHPVITDNTGQYLTKPASEYRCDKDTARASKSNDPKTIPYALLTSGDCVLEHGALTFNSSGEGQWQAKIHTNHTTNRDIWHVSLDVVESTGRPLFPVSLGDSPAMYGSPSPTIPWAVRFQFDASKFHFIDHVTIRTSC